MIVRFLVALLLAAPVPVVAQPVLAADAEARWVPFTLTPANHLRFAMTIDGQPATALLDTGLNYTAVSRDFARKTGLATGDKAAVRGVALGGSVTVEWAATRSITLGALSRIGGRIAVIELPKLLASASANADVLVGTDLISAYAIDIDFINRRFRVLPSGRMPFTGTRIPLSIQRGTGLYLTEAMVGMRRVRPLLVDTGDGGALSIARTPWRAARVRTDGVTSTIAYGAGGAVTSGLTVTDAVRMGDQPTGPIEVRIEGDGGFTRQVRVAGRIGTGLLLRYRLLLDPAAGQMVLRANPEAPPAPPRSTSGLLLGYDRARLRVLHVMAGSPAAATGWKADDLICAIDGTPVPPDPARIDVRWGTAAPGRIVRLSLCDGTEQALTLARFY